MNIALRITLAGGTNVDFYETEALDLTMEPAPEMEVQENDNELPVVQLRGDIWNVIRVKFLEFEQTTKAKLQQLINAKGLMTLYYEYQYNAASTKTVMLLPDVNEFRYFNGEQEATIEHEFIFLETS